MGKNMQENFKYLKERVIDALNKTDLEYIKYKLLELKDATIVSGVGGSKVVATFGSKVINIKNGIIAITSEPRTFIYRKNNPFSNVIACSYSGNNYGVDLSFANNLRKYLLSNNTFDDPTITYLKYETIDKEKSFISLGATLIPISILLNYYNNGNNQKIIGVIAEKKFAFNIDCDIYEIFSGYDTSTTSNYLESTLVEAGIGIPIIHDKYSYCHGRSTLSINSASNVIYLNRNTEFDNLILEKLKRYHQTIIVINSKYKDQILDDYQMLIQAMYLTKYIAEQKQKDLSKVAYSPMVKTIYRYSGKI